MKFLFKNCCATIYFMLYKFKLVNLKQIDVKNFRTIKRITSTNYKEKNIPRKIWMFWDGELSKEIKCFIDEIKRHNPQWELYVLNFDNINCYISDIIDWKNLSMPLANITDFIRIKLLYLYGGVWLDSSIILNQQLDDIIFFNEKEHYDLIGFYRDISTIDYNYPVLESWFLASEKNNLFIKAILDIYQPVLEMGSKAYFKKLQERKDYQLICQNINPPEYLIFYLAMQIAFRKMHNHINLYLYCADDTAYLIQDTLGWRSHKSTAYFFLANAPAKKPLLYKLTHGDRQYFHIIRKFRIMNPKSIMGELFQ